MQVEAEDVVVTLTPVQAQQLAGTLRVELAMQWEHASFAAIPSREEIEHARSLIDSYGELLERLGWGEPDGEISVRWPCDKLSHFVEELLDGAKECIADARSGQRGREMIATAHALAAALESRRPAALTS